VALVWM